MLKAQLLSSKELDYPSGSVLNFYKGELYLAGDDAGDMLILDTGFNVLRSVPLFPGTTGRIEKAIKADIEAGDFKGDTLWLFGSGSRKPYRDILFQYNAQTGILLKKDLSTIYKRLQKHGISNLNIEAAAFINGNWLLGSRSNSQSPVDRSQNQNYLAALPGDFAENQQNAAIKLILVHPPHPPVGISGMAYNEKEDSLLMTFSMEETPNAYDDGKPGNSFLALIRDISAKTSSDSLSPDDWLSLAEIDASFDNIKVESVAIGDNGVIFLAADNDNGKTGLYSIKYKV